MLPHQLWQIDCNNVKLLRLNSCSTVVKFAVFGETRSSVRIYQVQPFFVAGQCLSDTLDCRIIFDPLRGVEANLGWATDYIAQQFVEKVGMGSGADMKENELFENTIFLHKAGGQYKLCAGVF